MLTDMRRTEYIIDPATLRIVPAPPRWHERLLNRLRRAVAGMVAMQKYIK